MLGTFKSLMKESLARCAALRLLALHFPRSDAQLHSDVPSMQPCQAFPC